MSTSAESVDLQHIQALSDSLVEAHEHLLRSLVEMRKRHDLTQAEVAERMSVSQPTVAAFERYDANPTLATVRRYALAVGASVSHKVEDSCCVTNDERFEAVIAGTSFEWPTQRPSAKQWNWAGSPVVITVYGD